MKIEMKKFGNLLISRPAGRESLLVILSAFKPETTTELIELDFSDVLSVAPSWLDEVLTGLKREYGDRVIVLPSKNASLIASLRTIEEANTARGELGNSL